MAGRSSTGALALARAEEWAENRDIEFSWEYDFIPYKDALRDHDYWCKQRDHGEWTCQHEIACCLAYLDGEVIASLGGIIDADHISRRVIEAELALAIYNVTGVGWTMAANRSYRRCPQDRV